MSESNSASSAGGRRRRRGGRNRRFQRGQDTQGSPRTESRGDRPERRSSSHQAAAKTTNPIKRLLNWLFPSKKKEEIRPATSSAARSESRFPSSSQRTAPARETSAPDTSRERPSARNVEDVPVEVSSPRLYVGNLPFEAGESDLFDLFSKVGQVKNVEIVLDRRTNESKGFGFVEMHQIESAQKAAESLNRTEFMGRTIVVNGAKVDRRRREESTASADTETQGTGLSI